MRGLSRLQKFLAFSQFERDRWVARQAASLRPDSRVLDVGAGTCRYRPLFSHCEYRAQDFAQLPPDQIQGGYGKLDYVSDITALPVPDHSFECVLCTEVLEHVPEPIKAIREIARVLKPRGRLILTAPLGSGVHQEPYHFYGGFSPFWFERFLANVGFVSIRVEPNGGFFRFYGQESQRFVSSLFPRSGSRRWWRFALFPFWAALKLSLGVFVPVLCHYLDSLDSDRQFTVGYHVTAILNTDTGSPGPGNNVA